jgi:hypothetical protein
MRAGKEHHRKAADDRSDEADDRRPEKSRLHVWWFSNGWWEEWKRSLPYTGFGEPG